MSDFYALAKDKYENGKWTKAALRRLVDAGRLTADEFAEITGEAY